MRPSSPQLHCPHTLQANSSYPRGPSAWGAYEDPLAFVAGFLGWFAPSNIKAGAGLQATDVATWGTG